MLHRTQDIHVLKVFSTMKIKLCSRKKSWLAVTQNERITLMNFHGSSTSPYIIFSLSWTPLMSFNFLHSSKMSRRCTKTLLPWPRYTFFHRFMPGILRYISRRRSSVISFRITAFISFKVTYMTFRCYLFFVVKT